MTEPGSTHDNTQNNAQDDPRTDPDSGQQTGHYPDHILVIEEMPLLAVGLKTVFRSINPRIQLEHTSSVYTALSAKEYAARSFDLIILGLHASIPPEDLFLSVYELKQKFRNSRVMIYTDRYDPILIGKVKEGNSLKDNIDACVHKYEPIEEIRNAYIRLSAGEAYVSGILHTLYHTYRLDMEK